MLEVKHLSYEVTATQETLPIVTDINFTVNDGEMLVITGPREESVRHAAAPGRRAE